VGAIPVRTKPDSAGLSRVFRRTRPPTLTCREMRYWLMKPDPRLRSRVYCYYLAHPVPVGEWDAAAAYKAEELLIPDGHSEIVFNLGGAFERRVAQGATPASVMRESYVIGGRSQSVLTRDLNRVTVAGVKLDPRLLHALIRAPLGDFGEDTVSLSDLGNRALMDLEQAVAQESNCASRLATVLDQFFLRSLADVSPSSARIDALVREIHAHRDMLSILEWIRGHGFDPRNIKVGARESGSGARARVVGSAWRVAHLHRQRQTPGRHRCERGTFGGG